MARLGLADGRRRRDGAGVSARSPRVLIADALSGRAAEVLTARGIEVECRTGLDEAGLIACLDGYDGLVVRSATKVTKPVLAAGERLKVVGRAGLGVDNIDVPAATERGIVVMNTPGGNAVTTGEHAIALTFALARQIPVADRSTQAGKWEKSKFMGVELTGKTLGVVGCGNVGAIVAAKARGLGMRVIGYDPFLSEERAEALGIAKVDWDALLARADVITLHVPLTEQTQGMIDAAAIARMKPGVRLVNCARGELVVEADLKAGLESGQVAGAALDVFSTEPATQNILFGVTNVIATPHLGAATAEAQENVALQIADQMADYLIDGVVAHAVNLPNISAEDAAKLQPYLRLAAQLGSFAGQITETGLKAVTIEYAGEVTTMNTRALTAAALEGLLAPLLDHVNLVNAPVLARERGIQVREVSLRHDVDYQTLICLIVTTERGERSVAGTLFGGDKPHVVRIMDIPIEAVLGPHMLYVRNRDRPGIIGNLGRTLGDAGVNIATFNLGRRERGGDSIALIEVDEVPSAELLAQVRTLPNVLQTKLLRF